MNSTVKKLLLYIPAAGLGILCMLLQSRILAEGFDGTGLLILSNPRLWILWAVTGVYLLAALAILPGQEKPESYETLFPRCLLSGGVMIAAGVCLGFVGLNLLVPGAMGKGVFAIVAAGAMGLCGFYRLMGSRPVFVLDLTVGLYYAVHLLQCYSQWNANPQLQRYAFQLLAGIAVMLFCLHRARCAAGVLDRKRLVYMGFAGIFLNFVAMPGAESQIFHLASGLWCAGAMCDLGKAEPAVTEEPEETAE